MLAIAATDIGMMLASAPPVITTSASPRSIMRLASTKANMPAAQAATDVTVGPLMPRLIATWQDAMFGAYAGTVKMPTRLAPFSRYVFSPSAMMSTPPPPVFMAMAMLSRFESSIVRPLSSTACFAAATANWEKRAARRAAFASMKRSGCQSFTSAAIWQSWSLGSNSVMRRTPERPLVSESQNSSTLCPIGVTQPSPVTTALVTRRRTPPRRARRSRASGSRPPPRTPIAAPRPAHR